MQSDDDKTYPTDNQQDNLNATRDNNYDETNTLSQHIEPNDTLVEASQQGPLHRTSLFDSEETVPTASVAVARLPPSGPTVSQAPTDSHSDGPGRESEVSPSHQSEHNNLGAQLSNTTSLLVNPSMIQLMMAHYPGLRVGQQTATLQHPFVFPSQFQFQFQSPSGASHGQGGVPNVSIDVAASLPLSPALLANPTQGLRTNLLNQRLVSPYVAAETETNVASERGSAHPGTERESTDTGIASTKGATSDSPVTGEPEQGLVPGRPPISLAMSCDEANLPSIQCYIRSQIELFQATNEDVEANAQGRNRPIVLGQVGIRCRHCAVVPHQLRQAGASYFPSTVR